MIPQSPNIMIDTTLAEATASAHTNSLRLVLSRICASSEECRKKVSDAMLVSSDDTVSTSTSTDDQKAAKRRKVQKLKRRYVRCGQCKQDFDVVANEKEGAEKCIRHNGMLFLLLCGLPSAMKH